MRSIPTNPVAQNLWVVGALSCLVMIAGATLAGLVLLAVALVVAIALRILGMR